MTARTTIFLLNVFPTLPSGIIERIIGEPIREQMRYPTIAGTADGDLYRPSRSGRYPGVVVCLGVVPLDVDHPQVARLGRALARSGFVTLLYWSPAMRDIRLDATDIENIALAYEHLLQHPAVDPNRSGLIGTCVGGSFALIAGAQAAIRDRVAFIGAFAPYADLRTFARDISSASCDHGGIRQTWAVDPLTRKAYVRTMTEPLEPEEAETLRSAMLDRAGEVDSGRLSSHGQHVRRMLTALTPDEAVTALEQLPYEMRATIDAMSPVAYLDDLHAAAIIIGHDRDDNVIPVSESHQLRKALGKRPGFHYTEFEMFQHADPTKRKLSFPKLVLELGKFYRMMAAMYTQTETNTPGN